MEIGKPLRTVETEREPLVIAIPEKDWPNPTREEPIEAPIPAPEWITQPVKEPAEIGR